MPCCRLIHHSIQTMPCAYCLVLLPQRRVLVPGRGQELRLYPSDVTEKSSGCCSDCDHLFSQLQSGSLASICRGCLCRISAACSQHRGSFHDDTIISQCLSILEMCPLIHGEFYGKNRLQIQQTVSVPVPYQCRKAYLLNLLGLNIDTGISLFAVHCLVTHPCLWDQIPCTWIESMHSKVCSTYMYFVLLE